MKITDHRPRTSSPRGSIEEAVTREHIKAAAEVKRGEHGPALRRYRRVLCADPSDGIASRNVVWLAAWLDLSSELAAKAGEWALCQHLDNSRTKFLTGRTLFWRGRVGAAIPLLGATIREGPDPKRAFSLLGEAISLRRDVSDNPSLGGPIPAAAGHRLVAIVRDMVSIDHILPVAWRWSQGAGRDAVLVFIGPMARIDWRIEAARSMDRVHVRTLQDLAPDLDVDRMSRRLFSGAIGRAVIFDKSNAVMARVFGGVARRHGAAFVALPHGEEALTNKLVKPRDTMLPATGETETDLYDLSIHSSDFTVKKWGLHAGPSVMVLGSARYCGGWLRKITPWAPPDENLPTGEALHLVLFLPKPDFIVDWVELEQTISLLAELPDTTLLVKAHPRRGGRHRLVERNGAWDLEVTELAGRDAVERLTKGSAESGWISAAAETESATLINWADVVLSLGTSMTWQAVVENKPVLELSWCHGNFTTMAKYLPSTDIRCRDDLLDGLNRIRTGGPNDFYQPGERDAFIEKFIEPNREDGEYAVLDAYVATLERLSTRFVANPGDA